MARASRTLVRRELRIKKHPPAFMIDIMRGVVSEGERPVTPR